MLCYKYFCVKRFTKLLIYLPFNFHFDNNSVQMRNSRGGIYLPHFFSFTEVYVVKPSTKINM